MTPSWWWGKQKWCWNRHLGSSLCFRRAAERACDWEECAARLGWGPACAPLFSLSYWGTGQVGEWTYIHSLIPEFIHAWNFNIISLNSLIFIASLRLREAKWLVLGHMAGTGRASTLCCVCIPTQFLMFSGTVVIITTVWFLSIRNLSVLNVRIGYKA